MPAPGSTRTLQEALDQFRDEAAAAWVQMPDKALFLLLLAGWAAVFEFLGNSTFGYVDTPSLFHWMYRSYNYKGSEDAHGNLIPFVVLGLLWWKRKSLLACPKRWWGLGTAALGLAVGLHLLGYLVQQPRISIMAFFVGCHGLVALVYGMTFARACLFPVVLLVFCIPLGALAEPLTIPLRQVSTDIAVGVSRTALGIRVLQEGVQIMDPRGAYSYEVAAACSGIRSLVALLALTTIFAFVFLRQAWKRSLMVCLAVPLALGNNVLRLVSIIVASEAFGPKAGEFVHEWFGYVTYATALVAVLLVGHWLREPKTPAGELARTAAS